MQAEQWIRASAIVAALVFAGAVHAAACGSGTLGIGTLSTANVIINGHDADDCIGPVVADNLNEKTDLSGAFGGDWTYVTDGKIGKDGSGNFGGYTFTLDAVDGDSFLLTLAPELALPMSFDLIIGLKASNRYALYFFDDEPLSASNDGTYAINFQNNGGRIPSLSHLSLLVREGSTVVEQNGVPEPASLALVLAGLTAAGATRRRA